MVQEKGFGYLDLLVNDLKSAKDKWSQLPVKDKIDLLNGLIEKAGLQAQQWVDLSLQNKQLQPNSPYVGEEWSAGPWALVYAATEYRKTLEHIQANTLSKLIRKTSNRKDGQLKVRVFPSNIYEKLLFSKIRGEVWMLKGVTADRLENNMATFYKQQNPQGKVSLVLGAGNINAIAPLDTLYKLIICGEVVLLKMNPVNEYQIPVMEEIFKDFIDHNFMKITNGGAMVGKYLTSHPDIETIHITGSEQTHNAIVYGSGEEGNRRRKENKPVLDPSKEITSELGNIGPTIIVPGPWTKADIRYQCENIVTGKLHNNGFNCAASQVLVVPDYWEHSKEIVDTVSHLMKTIPYREAYYPGSAERQEKSVDAYPDAEQLTNGIPRTFIRGINSNNNDEYAFNNEFFGAVYAQTSVAGNTPLEFLKNAVQFCNEKLKGTLGANIIIHPRTIRDLGIELENCIAELRYGVVAINVWSAAAFLLPQSSWGAYPGHTYDDIQSGIGNVRNSLMFDKIEKTVYYGPFRPLPRAFNLAPPRPPWFVTNKTAHITMKRLTKFAVKPRIRYLPGIFYSALKG